MSKHDIKFIDTEKIKSNWFDDLLSDWKPDRDYIRFIQNKIKKKQYIAPVIVVKEKENYIIVNGHHRCYALLKTGAKEIKCLVIEGTFEQSEPLRKAELMLKAYDRETNYRYQFSGYLDRWAASVEGHDFINTYRPSVGYVLYRNLKKFIKKIRG
jgi:hypothetical protein